MFLHRCCLLGKGALRNPKFKGEKWEKGAVGASRASPALPALGYGLPRLLAARCKGCDLSPQKEDAQ